jgi:hypothetical protein
LLPDPQKLLLQVIRKKKIVEGKEGTQLKKKCDPVKRGLVPGTQKPFPGIASERKSTQKKATHAPMSVESF